jgi:hypothetical protein
MAFPCSALPWLRPLALLLPLIGGCALAPPAPAPDTDAGGAQALDQFVEVYRLADAWPRMAPKIARDSLPRLEDAIHADLDADRAADAAHARVPALLPRGRRELESALLAFDADEFARYTAGSIYGRYFDTAEIRQLNAFYGSPTGRKLTALGPEIVAEQRRTGADALARHFDAGELAQIAAFQASPVGVKLNQSARQVREDMHARFVERSEPALQALARRLATQAESDAAAPAR